MMDSTIESKRTLNNHLEYKNTTELVGSPSTTVNLMPNHIRIRENSNLDMTKTKKKIATPAAEKVGMCGRMKITQRQVRFTSRRMRARWRCVRRQQGPWRTVKMVVRRACGQS
jgi:hypothetical protein